MATETPEELLEQILAQYKHIDELKLLCDQKIVGIREGKGTLGDLMKLQNQLRHSLRGYVELSARYAKDVAKHRTLDDR